MTERIGFQDFVPIVYDNNKIAFLKFLLWSWPSYLKELANENQIGCPDLVTWLGYAPFHPARFLCDLGVLFNRNLSGLRAEFRRLSAWVVQFGDGKRRGHPVTGHLWDATGKSNLFKWFIQKWDVKSTWDVEVIGKEYNSFQFMLHLCGRVYLILYSIYIALQLSADFGSLQHEKQK